MAKVPNAVEILRKIFTDRQTDRQTDGRQHIAIVDVSARSLKTNKAYSVARIIKRNFIYG